MIASMITIMSFRDHYDYWTDVNLLLSINRAGPACDTPLARTGTIGTKAGPVASRREEGERLDQLFFF